MQRELFGIEKYFASPINQENVILGMKFTDAKFVQKAINNFKKIFVGLRLKIDNDHYCNMKEEVPLIKIPNWIQDCKMASDFMFKNHTIPLSKGLTTIGYNDRIVVVNSNHILNDGNFMISASEHSLDDDISNTFSSIDTNEKVDKKIVDAPLICFDGFKKEFERAEKEFVDKSLLVPFNKLSFCEFDSKDDRLAPLGTQYIDTDHIIPFEELKCYDKRENSQKLHNLSETTWTAVTMSISALSSNLKTNLNIFSPLATTIVVDARKFIDNQVNKITWRHGSCIAQVAVEAKPAENDTINDINQKFRDYLKKLIPNGIFYSVANMHNMFITPPNNIYGCCSSMGQIKIKKPVLDIDIQDHAKFTEKFGDHGENAGSQFTIFSHSKVWENKKEFHLISRHAPYMMTMENSKLLVESVKHFLKKIPLSAKYEEAHKELRDFQQALKDEL